jgi:hypothetical protein
MPAKGTTRREPWNPLLKSYPFSEKINALSLGAETLFTRLIAQADDYGNYYADPKMLLAMLFAHRWTKGEINVTETVRWRNELVTCTFGPLAATYSVNGTEYLHLINSRRRFRSDIVPDERFPREPSNLEEKVLSEYVTSTYHKRNVNVPLDLDPDRDKTQTRQDPEEHLVENDSTDLFEIFWKEFLAMKRNDGKVATRKAWITTTVNGRPGKNGHKPVEPSVIIQAAKHYRAFCEAEGTEPRYIKQPAAFLGPDRHWEDWNKPRKPSGGQSQSERFAAGSPGSDYANVGRKT